MINANRNSTEDREQMTDYQRESYDRRNAAAYEERAALLNHFRAAALQGALASGSGQRPGLFKTDKEAAEWHARYADMTARAMLEIADPEGEAEQSREQGDDVAALRANLEATKDALAGRNEIIRQVCEALGVTDGGSVIDAAHTAARALDRTRIALRLPHGSDLPAEAKKLINELVGYQIEKRNREALPANAINEAVAREREACAQIANAYTEGYRAGCNIAAAIRARESSQET